MRALLPLLLGAALAAQAPEVPAPAPEAPARETSGAVPEAPAPPEAPTSARAEQALRLQREAIAHAEAATAGLSGQYRIKGLQLPTLPHLPPGAKLRFEPSHLSKAEPVGRFFVVFRILADGRPGGSVRVDLEGSWTGRLLRTREPLRRNAVPDSGDLEELSFEGQPPPGALQEMPAGFRLRNALPAAHILTRADLEPIPLVNPGERVRLTLRSGDLSVSTEALARSHAGLGERVRLELPGGKRQVQAQVTGPGEATLAWAEGRK